MNPRRRKGPKGFELGEGRLHQPKMKRAHVATEFAEKDQPEVAESLARHLLPHLRKQVCSVTNLPRF